MQVLIYQEITASKTWNMEVAIAKPGLMPGEKGGFYSSEILPKGRLYLQWIQCSPPYPDISSCARSSRPFFPCAGQCKKGLGASISWERKRRGGNVICVRAVAGHCPQLMMFNAARCTTGPAGLEGAGRLGSCLCRFLGKLWHSIDHGGRVCLVSTCLPGQGQDGGLSWSWWSLWPWLCPETHSSRAAHCGERGNMGHPCGQGG